MSKRKQSGQCVPSASDVFLSKNDNSGGKIRAASEGVEYDLYFTEYDLSCVITCSDFYPLSNQTNLFASPHKRYFSQITLTNRIYLYIII